MKPERCQPYEHLQQDTKLQRDCLDLLSISCQGSHWHLDFPGSFQHLKCSDWYVFHLMQAFQYGCLTVQGELQGWPHIKDNKPHLQDMVLGKTSNPLLSHLIYFQLKKSSTYNILLNQHTINLQLITTSYVGEHED